LQSTLEGVEDNEKEKGSAENLSKREGGGVRCMKNALEELKSSGEEGGACHSKALRALKGKERKAGQGLNVPELTIKIR